MYLYSTYGKEKLKLRSKPMASGGEGEIYVLDNKKGYLAKIFHEGKRNKMRQEKLKYMIQNPPLARKHLVWPKDILLDEDHNFIGYLMKKVSGRKLELFCISKVERGFYDEFPHFEMRSKSTLKYRFRVAYQILASLYQLQESAQYILVDLKPENILLHTPTEFYILDLDSIQVVEDGKLLFPATVITPEYAPPEQNQINQQKQEIQANWDYFSWGIILYKFLYGVHPYAASSHAPYDQYTSLKQKIEQGLFVHHLDFQESFRKVPVLHNLFEESPTSIQQLFMQCFVDGHQDREARPSFGDWIQVLEYWVTAKDRVNFDYDYAEELEDISEVKITNRANQYVSYANVTKKEQEQIAELFETTPIPTKKKRKIPWFWGIGIFTFIGVIFMVFFPKGYNLDFTRFLSLYYSDIILGITACMVLVVLFIIQMEHRDHQD